ncbi:conserved Plasmodium protein, unknown function [Plasmodium ovale]|uniref:Transporter n=1 Tax=Plasmodium ovale TaxID=36330 RepID=A0A1D3TI80_PLAOA|nr:conserved Plasmodium protein, unknown function [Plasmodium ovale]
MKSHEDSTIKDILTSPDCSEFIEGLNSTRLNKKKKLSFVCIRRNEDVAGIKTGEDEVHLEKGKREKSEEEAEVMGTTKSDKQNGELQSRYKVKPSCMVVERGKLQKIVKAKVCVSGGTATNMRHIVGAKNSAERSAHHEKRQTGNNTKGTEKNINSAKRNGTCWSQKFGGRKHEIVFDKKNKTLTVQKKKKNSPTVQNKKNILAFQDKSQNNLAIQDKRRNGLAVQDKENINVVDHDGDRNWSKLPNGKNVSASNFLKKIKGENFQNTERIQRGEYLEERKIEKGKGKGNKGIIGKINFVNMQNEDLLGGENRSFSGVVYLSMDHDSAVETEHSEEMHTQNAEYNISRITKFGQKEKCIYFSKSEEDYVKLSSDDNSDDEGMLRIESDFFNERNSYLGSASREDAPRMNTPHIIRVKKFFLIFCNGCLVVFLGVSNNICGRMRNRVLRNFDSLTASYNAIAYVTIYLVLCIVYYKSRSITKEQWAYIYPCVSGFFKTRIKKENCAIINADMHKENHGSYPINVDVDSDKESDMDDDSYVGTESDANVRKGTLQPISASATRKKKIMKFVYIHKKRIYYPLLEKNESNVSGRKGENFLLRANEEKWSDTTRKSHILQGDFPHFHHRKSTCTHKANQRMEANMYEIPTSRKKRSRMVKFCHAGKSIVKGDASNEEDISNEEDTSNRGSTSNEGDISNEREVHPFDQQKIKDILENYKYGEEKRKNDIVDKYTNGEKVGGSVMDRWRNMGAYKYVLMIAVLDIISNTLYFVSQLAIPLTVLLLLNQLNFIFSIILSYIILKRKYNIHHAISVLIVIIGFLFFYIPYVYKENTEVTKRVLIKYYIDLNFHLNLSDALYSDRYNGGLFICNESLCSSPFGLFTSVFFCVFSILLTSFGGILREIFFFEYTEKKKAQSKANDPINRKENVKRYISHNAMDNMKKRSNHIYGIEEEKDVFLTNANVKRDNLGMKKKRIDDNHRIIKSDKSWEAVKAKVDHVDDEEVYWTSPRQISQVASKEEVKVKKSDWVRKQNEKRTGIDDRMSVILLSFNISLIQICLLPIIIYFQLLFNKNKDVSYFIFIKDSLKCFSGYTMENNENCRYAFTIYALYIIVNAVFNLSVSSFYSKYSSAECFLILKSSTPITLVVLYFYNFPFIADSDKYFSFYFLASIAIVFTGVGYFFYQNVVPRGATVKR